MAAIPVPPVLHLKFDNSLGAMLIGALISTALFGLTTLQTYLYFINYPNDRVAFRWMVALLWLLDFSHSIFLSHSVYHFLVQQYGNPISLLEGEWSIIAEVGMTIPVTLLVQGFMAHRVYKLSHGNWWLAGTIIIMSLSSAGLGFAATGRLVQIRLFSRLPEIIGIMTATLVTLAATDLFTTAALCWCLRRTQSSFADTQSAIRLLIIYTIETGLMTSVVVTIDAVCILTMPRNWIFIGITFCVSKLYANSLLTILNSRHSLKNKDGLSYKLNSSNNRNSHVINSLRMHDLSVGSAFGDKEVELQSKTSAPYAVAPFGEPPQSTNQVGSAV